MGSEASLGPIGSQGVFESLSLSCLGLMVTVDSPLLFENTISSNPETFDRLAARRSVSWNIMKLTLIALIVSQRGRSDLGYLCGSQHFDYKTLRKDARIKVELPGHIASRTLLITL